MQPGQTIEAPHMGMRVTWRAPGEPSDEDALRFELWIRADAPAMPKHVHPHQEERITVIKGSLRSRSGKRDRVLSPGDSVVTPPGEAHTIHPAEDEDVEILAELRPALAYESFIERTFELDRAGRVNAKGRSNPLRMAATGAREAEFFLAGVPLSIQRALLGAMERIGHLLGYDRPS